MNCAWCLEVGGIHFEIFSRNECLGYPPVGTGWAEVSNDNEVFKPQRHTWRENMTFSVAATLAVCNAFATPVHDLCHAVDIAE